MGWVMHGLVGAEIMKLKLTISQITKIAVAIVCIFNVLFLIMSIWVSKPYVILGAIILSLMTIVLICTMSYCTKKTTKSFAERLEYIIKEMLEGKNDINFTEEKETYFSSVKSDLYKLYEVLKAHKTYEFEEKLKLQELISDIAHQVKTPVFNLKTVNTILLDEVEDEHYREFLVSSMLQIEKLEFLMQALIKTSRLEMGIIEMHPCRKPLYITIGNAINGIIMQAHENNIDIEVVCNHDIQISHDTKWTEEALFNVLDNAVKYISNERKIVVTVKEWENYIKIEVADTGIGIKEEEISKIFKRFYRSSEVSCKKGVGIGLYIVRKIVDMQNGIIEIKSCYGKGTKFEIFLPNI